LVLLTASTGCQERSSRESEQPAGSVVVGDAAALRKIFAQLNGWAGTPLSRRATELATQLADCSHFSAEAPVGELDELLNRVRCTESSLPSGPLRLDRESGEIAFYLRPAETLTLAGAARISTDASVQIDLRVEGDSATAPLSFFYPAADPPGPSRLSSADALMQLRLRPAGGLRIAELIPKGSQGDRLFQLKSDLFAGAILDGAWEVAVYLPPPGRRMPLLALGVDTSSQQLAAAAMQRFLDNLEARWPIHETPFAVGDEQGACLLRLNLMPEFAPCYVATTEQLVVGWNADSVRQGFTTPGGSDLGSAGALVLHLDRFAEADRRLREAYDPGAAPSQITYGWERLVAHVEPEGAAMRIRIDLPASEAAHASASTDWQNASPRPAGVGAMRSTEVR